MKEKGDRVRLIHILEYANTITEWLSGVGKSRFFVDKQLQAAIIRQLEVIGEATKTERPFLNATSRVRKKGEKQPNIFSVVIRRSSSLKISCR